MTSFLVLIICGSRDIDEYLHDYLEILKVVINLDVWGLKKIKTNVNISKTGILLLGQTKMEPNKGKKIPLQINITEFTYFQLNLTKFTMFVYWRWVKMQFCCFNLFPYHWKHLNNSINDFFCERHFNMFRFCCLFYCCVLTASKKQT